MEYIEQRGQNGTTRNGIETYGRGQRDGQTSSTDRITTGLNLYVWVLFLHYEPMPYAAIKDFK